MFTRTLTCGPLTSSLFRCSAWASDDVAAGSDSEKLRSAWQTNFGCGATIQPLVASRRATLQGGPSRYSNSTMYCVNAWCDSPIIKCSTLSMGLAMRIWMCQFQKIIDVLCFMTVNCFVENVLGRWNYGSNQEQRWTFFDFSMGVTPNWRTEVTWIL